MAIVRGPRLDTRGISRRRLLGSVGATFGMSVAAGCGEARSGLSQQEGAPSTEEPAQPLAPKGVSARPWQYRKLDSVAVAAEAYRLMLQGGCMYGLFASIVGAMGRLEGEPYLSFPVHMMKYGEGGVGLWGSLCGTLNGGAAIIGLFVPDRTQRGQLIAELFAWYETAELPIYCPNKATEWPEIPKSIAGSVLCHVSVGRWCALAGEDVGSQCMAERCRRLTADVAAKTVELLNQSLREPHKFAGLKPEVKSCLACHGKVELKDTMGQMQCGPCHQHLSKEHPSVPTVPKATGDQPQRRP